jgi:hypothetical protein
MRYDERNVWITSFFLSKICARARLEVIFLLFFAAFDLLLISHRVMILDDHSITEKTLPSNGMCVAQFRN